ncbi:MAG: hypothetical protein PHG29_12765 [Prolixibacteraceae bacterium]|nr:hypothetical protein [Prolixibacteraceae bacterium]
MEKRYTIYGFFTILFIFSLFPGCSEKDKEDVDDEKEIISQEIRAGLTGEIVYKTQSNDVMKGTFHGSSVKLGTSVDPPKWSPNGNKIAFIENDNENISIKIFNKNGNQEYSWLLMPSIQATGEHSFTWSPDGSVIAMLTQNAAIIYLNVSTGEKDTTLIDQEGFSFRAIAWCPKNNKIAISQINSAHDKSISVINAFENNPQKELLVNTEDFVEYMDWNAVGSRLVYSGSGLSSIFTINFDGTGNQKIVTKGAFEKETVLGFAPCWMSNGEQIIYTGPTGAEGSNLILGLFVTDFEGTYNVDIQIKGKESDCM